MAYLAPSAGELLNEATHAPVRPKREVELADLNVVSVVNTGFAAMAAGVVVGADAPEKPADNAFHNRQSPLGQFF